MAEQVKRGKTAAVGQAAAAAVSDLRDRKPMDLQTPVTGTLQLPDTKQIALLAKPRLSDQEITELRHQANLPLPVVERCSELRLTEALRSLTILPRRADDLVTGELRLRLYRWQLSKFDEPSINHLVREALATCKWFPTPAECLAILARRDTPTQQAVKQRDLAAGRIRRELQQRYRDWLTKLQRRDMSQAEVDAAPENWKQTGDTLGLLRRGDDGRYVLRVAARINEMEKGEAA